MVIFRISGKARSPRSQSSTSPCSDRRRRHPARGPRRRLLRHQRHPGGLHTDPRRCGHVVHQGAIRPVHAATRRHPRGIVQDGKPIERHMERARVDASDVLAGGHQLRASKGWSRSKTPHCSRAASASASSRIADRRTSDVGLTCRFCRRIWPKQRLTMWSTVSTFEARQIRGPHPGLGDHSPRSPSERERPRDRDRPRSLEGKNETDAGARKVQVMVAHHRSDQLHVQSTQRLRQVEAAVAVAQTDVDGETVARATDRLRTKGHRST
jgi:hypothetical protein